MPRRDPDAVPSNPTAQFLDAIWEGQKGWAGIPTKPAQGGFTDTWFEWPAQREELLAYVESMCDTRDVFFVAQLQAEPARAKDKGARPLGGRWARSDLDGSDISADQMRRWRPIIIESGTPGHLHVWVRLDRPVDAAELERANRALTAELDGDQHPTHGTGLMRLPGTFNHKGGRRRKVVLQSLPADPPGVPVSSFKAARDASEALEHKVSEPLPDVIPQGERDQTLASYAGVLRRKGATADEILAALDAINTNRCEPPVSDADLRRIANSIASYPPADVPKTETEQADERATRVAGEVERLEIRREATQVVAAREALRIWTAPDEGGDLTSLLSVERVPVPHRIEGLGKVGGNTTIVAQYKAGKTTLIQNLAGALVDNTEFLGREVATPLAGNVALWNYELDHDEFVDWLAGLGIRDTDRIHVLTLRGVRHPLIVDHVAEWTAKWLSDREIEAWVLDPGARAFSGSGDENSNNDVSAFTEALDVVKKQAGVRDLYMTTHIGRMQEGGQERTRGASRWDDWPDVLWRMGRRGIARYFSAEGRKVEVNEFELAFERQTGRLSPSGGQGRAASALADGVIWLAQAVRTDPGRPKSHWESLATGGAKAFRAACDRALADGLVRIEIGSHNAKLLYPGAGS